MSARPATVSLNRCKLRRLSIALSVTLAPIVSIPAGATDATPAAARGIGGVLGAAVTAPHLTRIQANQNRCGATRAAGLQLRTTRNDRYGSAAASLVRATSKRPHFL